MVHRDVNLARSDFEFLRRVHVRAARWSTDPGTDFWFLGGGKDYLSASKTETLADGGWTTTTNVNTAGSVESFGLHVASAHPSAMIPTAASSVLASPAVFGDYAHMAMAANLFGKKTLPRYLICDIYGAHTTNSAAEKTSGFGFLKGAGSPLTQADAEAFIYSDGTNFQMDVGNANTSTTTAVDTKYHRWRLILDQAAGTATMNQDGTKLGAAQTLQVARFPLKFVQSLSTTNVATVGTVHIFYAYKVNQEWGVAAV